MEKTNKFYLLTFCEDWADEHNVPALACMTEKDFEDFKNKKFVSDKELLEKKEAIENYEREVAYYSSIRQKVEKYRKQNPLSSYAEGEMAARKKVFAEENLSENFFYKTLRRPILYVDIHAYLGNGGEGFNENFQDCYTGQDFIDKKYVKITEVDESFYNFFNQAQLSRLSLCSIFG